MGVLLERFLARMPLAWVYSLLRASTLVYRERSADRVVLKAHPKSADRFRRHAPPVSLGDRILGVVVQGPILRDHDYTLQTLEMYRKSTDIGLLVVSTWEDEDPDQVRRMRDLEAMVVLSPKPRVPGTWNINFQVASTTAGIAAARQTGCTHVLKTRTDQRLYRPNFASTLLALLDAFPCAPDLGQRSRIVVSGMNSFLYRPYSLSDMLVFGELEDMSRFWSIPQADGPKRVREEYQKVSLRRFMELGFPEMSLMEHFSRVLGGGELERTMEHYHRMVAERFLVVDPETIEQVWAKHASEWEDPERRYDASSVYETWSFARWLGLARHGVPGDNVPCDLDRTITDGVVVP